MLKGLYDLKAQKKVCMIKSTNLGELPCLVKKKKIIRKQELFNITDINDFAE